jgi:O-antigen/teichoic acid export membrane protein
MNILATWNRLGGQRSLSADASVTAVTNLAVAAMGFCTGIITARMLGPHGRGELAAIQTTPSFIGSFAMIGMPEALVYFSAQQPAQAGRYLVTAAGLSLGASVPFIAVAYLAMPLLLHAQGAGLVAAARWYLLIAPIWAIVGMMHHPLRGTGDFHSWNMLRLIVPLSALCVLGLAFAIGRETPQFLAFSYLVTYALMCVPSGWMVWRRLAGPFTADGAQIGPMLRYGLPCVMTGLPQMLNLRLDQMLMAAFFPPRQLGLYAVAVASSSAVSPLLTSIGTTLLPAIASADNRERASAHMTEGVRMTALLAIVACVTVATAAPFAIRVLYGTRFIGAIPAALILVPAAGVLAVNFSVQEAIRGFGRPYLVLRAELLGLMVTAISLALLLHPLGIVGAATASLLGYSTVCISLLASAKEIAGTSMRSLLVPRPSEMKRGMMRIAAAARAIGTSGA